MKQLVTSFVVCLSLALVACGGRGGGSSGATTDNNPNPPSSGDPGPTPNPGASPSPTPPATYTVGGIASGLKGSGLSLSINGGNRLAVPSNGSFVFGVMFASGQSYGVSVATQPVAPAQVCTVMNGANAVASSDVVNVAVVCVDIAVSTFTVGGTVSGLAGSGLILQNNGGDGRTISANGSFSFATPLANGENYAATVAAQPTSPGQQCTITNGNGTISGANVANIAVACVMPASPPPVVLASVSPPRLFAIHDQGDNRTLRAIASPGSPQAPGLFIRITGGEDVFDGIFQTGLSDRTFELSTETKKTLAAGTYTGAITVELCKDDQCAVAYPGAPVSVPYEVRVQSPTPNLSPLSTVLNGTDWQTPHGGNALHTGYVPIAIDPANFNRRWKWLPEDPKVVTVSEVVTYQGRAFVTTNMVSGIDPGGGFSAIAIAEATGQVAWLRPFERGPELSVDHMVPPTVDNGNVYAIAAGLQSVTAFALASDSGNQVWRSGFATRGAGYIDAPTISGGRLISHGGQSGGLVSLDAANGDVQWFSDGLFDGVDYFFTGSVAADGTTLYAVVPETGLSSRPVLGAYAPATGAKLYTIDTSPTSGPDNLRDPSPAPVITGANSVVIGYEYAPDNVKKHRLERFNTQSRSVTWSVDSDGVGGSVFDPVVANGIVYAVNSPLNRVEARNELDGTLLWTWAPPTVDQSRFSVGGARLIVTNNLLFAATDRFVYAISLAEHADVWSHWNSGTLALSANGVLYVKYNDKAIDAINLK